MKKLKLLVLTIICITSYCIYSLEVHKVFDETIDANGLVVNCVSPSEGAGITAEETYRYIPSFVSCAIRDANTERVLKDFIHYSDLERSSLEMKTDKEPSFSKLEEFSNDFSICDMDEYLASEEINKKQCRRILSKILLWGLEVLPEDIYKDKALKKLSFFDVQL